MLQDLFGQEATLVSRKAQAAWDQTAMAFLAHSNATPQHLADTLEHAPDFALAHAVRGMFYLLLGRRELVKPAAEAHACAVQAARKHLITARETLYIDALRAYLSADLPAAVRALETVLEAHPADALAMKLSHAIRFVQGDMKGMRRSVERVRPAYDGDHPAYGYLLGCHAFSLEETGDYRAAEQQGREAVSRCSDDAWGLHAVAHVYDMTCDAKGGLDWLSGREASWAHCNNFRYHVWWHKALMHLDLGQVDQVLELYDSQIRAEKTDDYRDISNGASLLGRLELEGIDVGDRWEELADFSMERTEDGCLIFADLHYLLALIGGNREDAIIAMMARLHNAANTSENQTSAMGLEAAKGLRAFGEADYSTAFTNLSRARRALQLAGGSHAQRDIFERLTIDAGLRAGHTDAAAAILQERKNKRKGGEDRYHTVRMSLISEAKRTAACLTDLPAK